MDHEVVHAFLLAGVQAKLPGDRVFDLGRGVESNEGQTGHGQPLAGVPRDDIKEEKIELRLCMSVSIGLAKIPRQE